MNKNLTKELSFIPLSCPFCNRKEGLEYLGFEYLGKEPSITLKVNTYFNCVKCGDYYYYMYTHSEGAFKVRNNNIKIKERKIPEEYVCNVQGCGEIQHGSYFTCPIHTKMLESGYTLARKVKKENAVN